jgi:hypothetical protein
MATAAIPVILTGLQVIMQTQQARQSAKEQADYAAQQYRTQKALTEVQSQQINTDTAREMGGIARQALVEQSRLAVAAGEAGVGGGLLDRLSQDIAFKQSEAMGSLEERRFREQQNLAFGSMAQKAQAESTANQALSAAPTWLSAGLKIGSAVASMYGEQASKQAATGMTDERRQLLQSSYKKQ